MLGSSTSGDSRPGGVGGCPLGTPSSLRLHEPERQKGQVPQRLVWRGEMWLQVPGQKGQAGTADS